MTDEQRMALIHAELDGELDGTRRAELARLLLAEPQTRVLRDQMQGVCSRLDAVGQVEPPPQLRDSVLQRLPSAPPARVYRASFARWRLAALFAGMLTATAIVYETLQGPTPGSRETAGTMAADVPIALDSVALDGGAISGRATLYRDKTGLGIGLDVSAAEPVDVLIATGSQSFRINGLSSPRPAESTHHTLALPGVRIQGQDIDLSFLIGERTVERATLHTPSGP
ncbi:MAG: hypothetical protein ACTHL7_02490 [Steroidobacteraceae bacterium]